MIKKELFSIQLLDIVSVENSQPASNYPANEIEALADNYLECGGNLNPILVETIGLDEYRVVEGDLELYAAKKAREKYKFFEMIRAVILNDKNKDLINEQLSKFKSSTPRPITNRTDAVGKSEQTIDNSRLTNLEKSLTSSIENLATTVKEHQHQIDKLFKINTKSLSYLDYFNESFIDKIINILDSKCGMSYAEAKKYGALIYQEREANGKFKTFLDISDRVTTQNKNGQKRRIISHEKMFNMIDHWIQSESKSTDN
ncbi:hypothetical protein [Synechocystis sp. PCC 7338]|uniref:hypothetical protein n=1 Tax=Synechocystis sp. PCC 7338 TaxID=2732530 RepID=UPI001BAEFBD6|nr:hypothetical protein [Synechocystis sp. PCC 7338]QUS61429.1 hypothetical protein HTZ78_12695 [Synechocystis sp. PCC 7338]